MRHLLWLAAVISSMAAGCASEPLERHPADDVAWVNMHIDAQRVVKRRLLRIDPIERRAEEHLRRDPRVESARLAIGILDFGSSGVSDDAPFFFATVVTTREPMPDEDARRLLEDAFRAAGATLNLHYSEIIRDGNTWAVRTASVQPTLEENPDLSVLQPATEPTTSPATPQPSPAR